jgi:hypothetical protein
MRVPDKAIEAAAKAVFYDDRTRTREEMFRIALEAAAPFIAAQAWDEGADAEFQRSVMKRQTDGNPYRSAT